MSELSIRDEALTRAKASIDQWVACGQRVGTLTEAIAQALLEWRRKGIAESASSWLPIKSAPKDGTVVLLYARDWSEQAVSGSWNERVGAWDTEAGCMEEGPAEAVDALDGPTHWMPLPDPPAPAAHTGEQP